ncbi:helical backbone metal receptor [Mucilaginibacter sp. UR6-11]|uniref:helical backbone metal receptor n=1 Tax=Mucilaginibacter sp. UR6-11 TaxID=1435644 RepID=UPI001E3C0F3F|nr:helical backbone metal receptor [Mucilaginibacter sp. UR6-11]MCC8426081.1 helical backbone metal receptor [Mucilaginibacter sp. UR6-11]
MAVFYDQLNRKIELPGIPQRIVSVVPSQTELLFYLGLDKEVVGITKFCVHPAGKFNITVKVGGTKQLNIELIKELRPDLIIANKEENDQSQIEELAGFCPVWVSDINDLASAYDMILKVGALVAREGQAQLLVTDIKYQFSQLTARALNLKAAYLIWRKPYMVAGRQTFIDHLLQKCGLINAFDGDRYPEVTSAMLIAADPAVVLLSSEPYPFAQKHLEELKQLLPKSTLILVDGELFSWYGSRLLLAPAYFKQLIENISAKQ